MVSESELRTWAADFANSNPRYMEYGAKFLQAAIKTQKGVELQPLELQSFIKSLTGLTVDLKVIEEHLKP